MCWRLVSIEVNLYERYDGFTDTQALKVFPMSTARAASQRHTEPGHHKITAILDASVACFHTDIGMNWFMNIHQEKLSQSVLVGIQSLSKVHSGARRAARAWQEFFRNEVFVSAGGNAEALEPNAYHKAECWDDDDSFTIEWRMDVFQDVNALKEHNVDIKSTTITETATKIVKQVSNWRLAGIMWVRLEPKAAVLTPNKAATTRTTRNTLNELVVLGSRRAEVIGWWHGNFPRAQEAVHCE